MNGFNFWTNEAYISVCKLRLTGAKQIKKVAFQRIYGAKKRGDVLATIQFDNRKIDVHMPVEGKIISINDVNLLVNQNFLLTQAEKKGWLVKIRVSKSFQKTGLLYYKQYISN